ncbi:ABC transporter permease [Deinococcus gobiensis]|uniref:ABC-type transport system, permease component n=1 Tax=Deinococcus gobiensis (strain DSM 21396 / JCM 16679 / CGMCC 1.7299 / I-0) TaxID=745776 RepID=H8GZQ8_DEIGI|nr:ABC transporter permease [Deinococcus gobiensis]AFD25027.1 ABC-type transport system, permease component [Deinococcus gobiensis I-0]
MLTLILLELRKLLTSRSARLGLAVSFLLPLLWAAAPRMNMLLGDLALVSGWQLPAVSIGVAVQFMLPLFIALTVSEMIGSEVSQGTLAPLLLRPVGRTQVIASKLVVALLLPFLLIAVTVLGSLLAGIPRGFGAFTGGTGMGPGLFVGVGQLGSGAALLETLRGSFLAALMLMPIAALSLLFGVLFLNTAASTLATLAALNIMRLLVVFPESVQRILLTSHFALYAEQGSVAGSVALLLIYTAGFGFMAIFAFDRRDV